MTDAALMHIWAVATAAVVAAGCAVVGTLLVVRRLSLLGDAVSHAILPGIVVAVLAGGSPGGPLALAGGAVAALATVGLAGGLRQWGGLSEDTAAGVVFTTFFASGVTILSLAASRADLDPGCVLYGLLEFVAVDRVPVAGLEVPRTFLVGACVLFGVGAFLRLTWAWQLLTAFDAEAARVVGVPTGVVTGGLLVATAVTIVAGFEAVGAILIVALLVVPAATAELLARSLPVMMGLAVGLGVVGSAAGYALAWRWNANAAGSIAVVLGVFHLMAVVLGPQGLTAGLIGRGRLAWRVACEDVLAAAWRRAEAGLASPATVGGRSGAAGSLLTTLAGWWLARRGLLSRAEGREGLSSEGSRRAERIVRGHRLWEAWLGRNVELPPDHLHPPAEWIEHHLGAELRRRLEAEITAAGGDLSDPHGRGIPAEPDRPTGGASEPSPHVAPASSPPGRSDPS